MMLRRQLQIFLMVGALTVVVDLSTYRLLVALVMIQVDIAKAIGFVCGATFAYFTNRRWTFMMRVTTRRHTIRFISLYLFSMICNVMINSGMLMLLHRYPHAILISFLSATLFCACLNFIGMKYFVFISLGKGL